MPAVSQKQARFFQLVAHNKEEREKLGISQHVAEEFEHTASDSDDTTMDYDGKEETGEIIEDCGILVDEELSPNISVTPEGYLLCKGAVLARTGTQEYTSREIPVDPDSNGKVTAHRTQEEVFDDHSLASYTGKPITIEHPPELITPSNWKRYAVGTVTHAYQDGNFVKGDLLITDVGAISRIQDQGMRKLSVGYNSTLEDLGGGHVNTTNIRTNHLALTLNPRGGDSLMIHDSINQEDTPVAINNKTMKGTKMAQKQSTKQKVLRLLGLMDSQVDEIVEDLGDSDETDETVTDSLIDITDDMSHEQAEDNIYADLIRRIEALEALNKTEEDVTDSTEEDVEVTDSTEEDKEAEVTDSNCSMEDEDADGEYAIADSFNSVLSKAEILVPGIKVPTPINDSGKEFVNSLTEIKRVVLQKAFITDSAIIGPLLKGRFIEKLNKDAVEILFDSVYQIKAQSNNSGIKSVAIMDSHSTKSANPFEQLINKHKQLNNV